MRDGIITHANCKRHLLYLCSVIHHTLLLVYGFYGAECEPNAPLPAAIVIELVDSADDANFPHYDLVILPVPIQRFLPFNSNEVDGI